jgi:hypothetical protein
MNSLISCNMLVLNRLLQKSCSVEKEENSYDGPFNVREV